MHLVRLHFIDEETEAQRVKPFPELGRGGIRIQSLWAPG